MTRKQIAIFLGRFLLLKELTNQIKVILPDSVESDRIFEKSMPISGFWRSSLKLPIDRIVHEF